MCVRTLVECGGLLGVTCMHRPLVCMHKPRLHDGRSYTDHPLPLPPLSSAAASAADV
jgi:hypothetical protein